MNLKHWREVVKKHEIKVGGQYKAKVNGNLVTVRVDAMRERYDHKDRATTVYDCTNLATGRKVAFRSAAKFRSLAGVTDEISKVSGDATLRRNNRPAGFGGQYESPKTTYAKPLPEVRPAPVPAPVPSISLTDESPHLIVEARAGTGKTTTLIDGVKRLMGLESKLTPSPQQAMVWDCIEMSKGKAKTVCFVAFNRGIAAELKTRVPAGCEAMTMHGLGLRAVRAAFRLFGGEGGVSEWRVRNIIGELVNRDIRDFQRENPILVKAVEELVGLCKMNLLSGAPEELDQVASHYEVETNGQRDRVYELVPRVLERCKQLDRDGCVDYNDMIWLPVVLDLPVRKFDVLLVDECLPGWTPVMLADGRSATIKEIVESNQEIRVRAYDTTRGVGKNCRVIGRQRILNQKPLVKVKVRHLHRTGTNRKCNFLVCTTDHKVWTVNRGWVEAGELKKGDDVIVETAAKTTQKGKVTGAGREKLANLQAGNVRGLGNSGGDPTQFNRIKGGNGRGPTLAEQTLLDALGEGWEWNHTVKTGDAPQYGRGDKPSHYKVDIANPHLMVAVEVDGVSHRGKEDKDHKKDTFLRSIGWTVVRVSNRRAIQNASEEVCRITGNCPRPARVVSVDSVTIPDPYVYDITVEDCHNFYANGILVHNCQDLNKCQQALAKMAGRRLILCGDPKQAIYGFAGADAESMRRMEAELGTTPRGCVRLPLTVTRRCGKAIVGEANRIVPDFEAFETNGEGKVWYSYLQVKSKIEGRDSAAEYTTYVKDGDMVLCRVNAPLVSECFRFIRAGRKANIQGRDVGKGLINTVKKLSGGEDRLGSCRMEELIAALGLWLEGEQRKESAKKFPSESKMISLQDKHDCLLCFTEGLGVDAVALDVIRKIEAVFTDDREVQGIRLSSIHKAKGLEAHRVFFLEPEGASVPHPMAKSRWQVEQEWNLRYVAITRAIEELVYVS